LAEHTSHAKSNLTDTGEPSNCPLVIYQNAKPNNGRNLGKDRILWDYEQRGQYTVTHIHNDPFTNKKLIMDYRLSRWTDKLHKLPIYHFHKLNA